MENTAHYEKSPDPIVESVIQRMRRRSIRGVEKYGMTLAENPADLLEWIQHLQEEMMDAALYCERLKMELNNERDDGK